MPDAFDPPGFTEVHRFCLWLVFDAAPADASYGTAAQGRRAVGAVHVGGRLRLPGVSGALVWVTHRHSPPRRGAAGSVPLTSGVSDGGAGLAVLARQPHDLEVHLLGAQPHPEIACQDPGARAGVKAVQVAGAAQDRQVGVDAAVIGIASLGVV